MNIKSYLYSNSEFMKKNVYLSYPAVITKEGDSYWVQFIDLEGCFSDGCTFAEAMEHAKEAMGLYLEDLDSYPESSTDLSQIKLRPNQVITFISINMDEHRKKYEKKSVKKTLSIPGWLNTMAENKGINFSQVLQEALKEKLNIDDEIKK